MSNYRVEESFHIGFELKAGKFTQHVLKCLLKHIKRKITIARKAISQIGHPMLIAHIQLGKGINISKVGCIYKLLIA